MLLLRTLLDLASASAEFRAWFNSKWGCETCVIWGRARQARFGPRLHALSIRAAWGGEERCKFNGRTVAGDDDSFLILNNGHMCETQIDSVQPVESFSIHFRPGLVEHGYGALTLSIEGALARGDLVVERATDAEHNTLMELKGEPDAATWNPDTEVFADEAHLTRAGTQLPSA